MRSARSLGLRSAQPASASDAIRLIQTRRSPLSHSVKGAVMLER